jgi:dsRNA-specific ribonuclease
MAAARSKKEAEQMAAKQTLEKLKEETPGAKPKRPSRGR